MTDTRLPTQQIALENLQAKLEAFRRETREDNRRFRKEVMDIFSEVTEMWLQQAKREIEVTGTDAEIVKDVLKESSASDASEICSDQTLVLQSKPDETGNVHVETSSTNIVIRKTAPEEIVRSSVTREVRALELSPEVKSGAMSFRLQFIVDFDFMRPPAKPPNVLPDAYLGLDLIRLRLRPRKLFGVSAILEYVVSHEVLKVNGEGGIQKVAKIGTWTHEENVLRKDTEDKILVFNCEGWDMNLPTEDIENVLDCSLDSSGIMRGELIVIDPVIVSDVGWANMTSVVIVEDHENNGRYAESGNVTVLADFNSCGRNFEFGFVVESNTLNYPTISDDYQACSLEKDKGNSKHSKVLKKIYECNLKNLNSVSPTSSEKQQQMTLNFYTTFWPLKLYIIRNVICAKCTGKGSRECAGRQGSGSKVSVKHLGPSRIRQMQRPGKECKGVGKLHSYKANTDEGIPVYRRSFLRGKLYNYFNVDFPDLVMKEKQPQFGHIPALNIGNAHDAPNIGHMPLLLQTQKGHDTILKHVILIYVATLPKLQASPLPVISNEASNHQLPSSLIAESNNKILKILILDPGLSLQICGWKYVINLLQLFGFNFLSSRVLEMGSKYEWMEFAQIRCDVMWERNLYHRNCLVSGSVRAVEALALFRVMKLLGPSGRELIFITQLHLGRWELLFNYVTNGPSEVILSWNAVSAGIYQNENWACKLAACELDAVVPLLAGLKEPVIIVKVDADRYDNLAFKHEIDEYPNLKLFLRGGPTIYNGPQKIEALVSHLMDFVAPHVSVITSESALKSFVDQAGNNFPIFIGIDVTESVISDFVSQYKKKAWFSVAMTFSEDVMVLYDFDDIPTSVAIRPRYDERNIFYGSFDDTFVDAFVKQNLFSLIMPMNYESLKPLTGAAAAAPRDFLFAYVGVQQFNEFIETFEVRKKTSLPKMVVCEGVKMCVKYSVGDYHGGTNHTHSGNDRKNNSILMKDMAGRVFWHLAIDNSATSTCHESQKVCWFSRPRPPEFRKTLFQILGSRFSEKGRFDTELLNIKELKKG